MNEAKVKQLNFILMKSKLSVYLMGDHEGVLNFPLIYPTNLSIFSFNSLYSGTSVLEGTATLKNENILHSDLK